MIRHSTAAPPRGFGQIESGHLHGIQNMAIVADLRVVVDFHLHGARRREDAMRRFQQWLQVAVHLIGDGEGDNLGGGSTVGAIGHGAVASGRLRNGHWLDLLFLVHNRILPDTCGGATSTFAAEVDAGRAHSLP